MFKIGLLIVSITSIVIILNGWNTTHVIGTASVFFLIGWGLVTLGLLLEGYPMVQKRFNG